MRPLGVQRIDEVEPQEDEFPPSDEYPAGEPFLHESFLHSNKSMGRHARERESSTPWLSLYIPVAAFALSAGALFWSSHLRGDVQRQDDSIAAIQRENQRMADNVQENTVELKAAGDLAGARQGINQPGSILQLDKPSAEKTSTLPVGQGSPAELAENGLQPAADGAAPDQRSAAQLHTAHRHSAATGRIAGSSHLLRPDAAQPSDGGHHPFRWLAGIQRLWRSPHSARSHPPPS